MASTTAGPTARRSSTAALVPNINPNPRGGKQPKRGRKAIFEPAIFEERFRTIERVFARPKGQVPAASATFRAHQRAALCIQDPRLHDDQSPALLPDLIPGRWLNFLPARRAAIPLIRCMPKSRLERQKSLRYVANRASLPCHFQVIIEASTNSRQNPQPVVGRLSVFSFLTVRFCTLGPSDPF